MTINVYGQHLGKFNRPERDGTCDRVSPRRALLEFRCAAWQPRARHSACAVDGAMASQRRSERRGNGSEGAAAGGKHPILIKTAENINFTCNDTSVTPASDPKQYTYKYISQCMDIRIYHIISYMYINKCIYIYVYIYTHKNTCEMRGTETNPNIRDLFYFAENRVYFKIIIKGWAHSPRGGGGVGTKQIQN